MTNSHVIVQGVLKRFGPTNFVGPVDLTIERGEIIGLLGPSGCGKTTLLRCIAGLEQPTEGEISIGGRLVFSATRGINEGPEARQIGLVFQSYALWPHMSVAENVAYGLKLRKIGAAEIERRVTAILASMGLAGMAERSPSTLSGGQQQRVAIARSLVVEANVILFDEPLSNLDVKLREEMRFELRRLIKQAGVTGIFVTHDQSEAMVLADRICLMRQGKVEQVGSPRDLYHRPTSPFAMNFLGDCNVLPLAGSDGGVAILENGRRLNGAAAGDGLLAIRPETVEIVAADDGRPNVLPATLIASTFLGAVTLYDADAEGLKLRVSSPDPDRRIGDRVGLHLPARYLLRVSADG